MNFKLIAFVCVVLFACGCNNRNRNHYQFYKFDGCADALNEAYDYWIKHGRPSDFQPYQIAGATNEFFVYTNVIKTTNGVFHCRFGASRPFWPPGVLAITDEHLVIFVCSTNGKVTISPEKYGVDP